MPDSLAGVSGRPAQEVVSGASAGIMHSCTRLTTVWER
jgi:hypothetical protein